MKLLIGSSAVDVVYPGILSRNPTDIDYIGSFDSLVEYQQLNKDTILKSYPIKDGSKIVMKTHSSMVEYEVAWDGSTGAQLIELVKRNSGYVSIHNGTITPNLDVLFTLKTSHRFLSHKYFDKTISDWTVMKSIGAKVPEWLKDWLKEREAETYKNRKYPKLNVGKEVFFNSSEVNYVYDHDSIHRAVAYGDVPAYTLFKKQDSEVACDKNTFNLLPYETRLCSIAEEAYVLAIERSHVPYGTWTPWQAFKFALEKVCTVISSGWWREFAYQNYYDVIKIYRDDYLDRFNSAWSAWKILPFVGNKY